MGLFSDIVEENMERHYDHIPLRIDGKYRWRDMLSCSLCSKLFLDEKALMSHVAEQHRDHQQYVRLNGRIIGDLEVCCEPIESLRVVHFGKSDAEILLCVGDVSHRGRVRSGASYDLMPFLGTKNSSILLKIVCHSVEREVTIIRDRLPFIELEHVRPILDYVQHALDVDREIDWSEFATEIRQDGLSQLERRYLQGFYEYYLAYYLDANECEGAGKHLEQALALLRPYPDPLAQTAVRYIAYRFNWFSELRALGSSSLLGHVTQYFTNPAYRVGVEHVPDLKGATAGLLIDDANHVFLEAVRSLLIGDLDLARPQVELLAKVVKPRIDQNLLFKITLVKARLVRETDTSLARYLYGQLTSHPFFSREADAYINECSAVGS